MILYHCLRSIYQCLWCVCFFVSRCAPADRHSREISEIVPAHTRAHARAESTRTRLSCGGDECDADQLSLLIHIHTNMHASVSVCVFILFFVLEVYLTSVCLTRCFSSIQAASFVLTLAHTLSCLLPTGRLIFMGINCCAREAGF
jgi:hypothetical protein